MTKDEAVDIVMKEYAQTHYPDDCKTFKQGYEAGWANAEQNVAISYLSERHFCPRCGKRLGLNTAHTCTPPRTFDDYGNKLP